MKVQRIFVFLILTLIALSVVWFVFLYSPLELEAKNVKLQLAEVSGKLKHARNAQRDLQLVEKRLAAAEEELEVVKLKIVDRKNLTHITEALRSSALAFDLEITDFTPVLDNYFERTGNKQVKSLPLLITLEGRFLNIGKFIESWEKLDFYLTVHEIIVEKLDTNSNDLTATVTCNLYTWNN